MTKIMQIAIVIALSIWAANPSFTQTANSTAQTVCNGSYCQQVGGALLQKLINNGWKVKNQPVKYNCSFPSLSNEKLNKFTDEVLTLYKCDLSTLKNVAMNSDYARLADASYSEDLSNLPSWEVIGGQSAVDSNNAAVTVFKNTNTSEVVVAFRGTTNDGDLYGPDIQLGTPKGLKSISRFSNSLIYSKKFLQMCNCKATFVGHSLGGGIAQYVGAMLNQKVVAFDPAPLGIAASKEEKTAILSASILNFRGSADPLTAIFKGNLLGPKPITIANASQIKIEIADALFGATYNHASSNLSIAMTIASFVNKKIQEAH
jgi:hypothetical protein